MAVEASWYVRLAEGLVRRVAATDLGRLNTTELNTLRRRFQWFRVEAEDGHEAVYIVNGLVVPVTEDVTVGGLTIRASQDEYAIEGDEELSADLNAAITRINVEIARRVPREEAAWWAHYRRYEARQQRLAQRRDAEVAPVVRVGNRNREQRPRAQHRSRVSSGRGPPSRSEDDEPHEHARRASGPAGASPEPVAARRAV